MTINYSIQLLEYWQAASGQGRGSAADSATIKDRQGLPYLPGKTIKGLFKHAAMQLVSLGAADDKVVDDIFGRQAKSQNDSGSFTPGSSHWTNAHLARVERQDLVQARAARYLFDTVVSTAINSKGTAVTHSLRTAEVCIPLTLHGSIEIIHVHGPQMSDDTVKKLIGQAACMVRRLGAGRNRGLGRCKITVKEEGQ